MKGPGHPEAGQVDLIHRQALFAWAQDGNIHFPLSSKVLPFSLLELWFSVLDSIRIPPGKL